MRLSASVSNFVCLLAFGVGANLSAQSPTPTDFSVAVGQSAPIRLESVLSRTFVSSPEVVEAIVITPRDLEILGKTLGTSSMTIWLRNGKQVRYRISVVPDIESVSRAVRGAFPREQFEISNAGGSVAIRGTASSQGPADGAVALIKSLGYQVVNNVDVPAVQPSQVMLEVRFAEVSRSAARDIGLNLLEGTDITSGLSGVSASLSDIVRLMLFRPGVEISALVDALQERGIYRSLAEPNLIAADGEEATFLAGGEFPYPVPQGAEGRVTIMFKEFGVRLAFTPKVESDGGIWLNVAPEVSSLDFGNGLEFAGFRIPTILTRRAHTSVRLRDGQSFAIAGLVDNSITDNASQFPILSSIPVLGKLFNSQDLRERQTELLVIVTPRLVAPTNDAIKLPGGLDEGMPWSKNIR